MSLFRSICAGKALWASLALIAANLVVYAPVRHYDFVAYDDPQYVSENVQVLEGLSWNGVRWALTTREVSNWHPLTWLSLMLDVELFGVDAGALHVTSVIFHSLNSILLFGLLRRLTGAMGKSAFVAALFAIHPMHVESVAWISERKDVLSTLFLILTIWAYASYVQRRCLLRYGVTALLMAMGLMTKPMLVTLPFALLLLDYWPLGRLSLPTSRPAGSKAGSSPLPRSVGFLLWEKVPLFALAGASSLVTFLVQRQGGAVSGLDALPLSLRLENALVTCVVYVGKMLWPARLAAFYPYPRAVPGWWVAGAALVLFGATVLVVRGARRYPYLPVGWLWYLGTLVPVIGLVQVGMQSRADRYTYVPLVGLFILAAWAIPDLVGPSRARQLALRFAALVVILSSVMVARGQVATWSSSRALWTHALEVTTENWPVHRSLAAVLADDGRLDEAIVHFNESLRLRPDFAESHMGLGAALADQGKIEEAVPHYREALRLKRSLKEAHNNLANALWSQGKLEEAISHYSEALRLDPAYAEAHNGLGAALDDQGKVEEAIAHYTDALRLKPNNAEAYNNLGAAFAKQGKIDEALREFERALRINPGRADVHYNMAVMLERKGETTEAIQHLETALNVNPNYPEAKRALDLLRRR